MAVIETFFNTAESSYSRLTTRLFWTHKADNCIIVADNNHQQILNPNGSNSTVFRHVELKFMVRAVITSIHYSHIIN